jgi:glycerol-3-phosphate acyltransferase PlsY
MLTATNIFFLIIAYLVGSIPSAVWIGKYFYKIDVREYGSGNAGATNVFRVLGKRAGIPVLLMDIMKGFAAVSLAYLSKYPKGSSQLTDLELVLGIAALLGHIFPLFAQFRGGKGIATLLGIILAVHLYAGLLSMGVFIIVLLLFSYVSLASIIASILFPIIIIIINSTFKAHFATATLIPVLTKPLIIFSILIPIMVIITHQKNIERLLRREESKANILKKKVKK